MTAHKSAAEAIGANVHDAEMAWCCENRDPVHQNHGKGGDDKKRSITFTVVDFDAGEMEMEMLFIPKQAFSLFSTYSVDEFTQRGFYPEGKTGGASASHAASDAIHPSLFPSPRNFQLSPDMMQIL